MIKITYIHHSAFLVELDQIAMIFDYTEGGIPELEKDKPLFVFASHRHGDHYSPMIFEWKKDHPNIRYVLANDIWRKHLPEEVLPVTDTIKRGQSLGYELNHGSPELATDENVSVRVTAYRSTDEGVAFLVETEGKKFYHGGDLNNWYWDEEPEDWNQRMAKRYSEQVDLLVGQQLDVAFLPLDPRQGAYFYLGMDEFLRKVEVNQVFPMHCWGDYSVIQKLKNMPCAAAYKDRITDITQEATVFFC